MSKRINELFLFEIYIAMLKIEYVSDKFNNPEDLKYDFIHWDSIIREFEIIGEATNILINNNILDNNFRVVVDFRNKIIHHYFGIDSQAVWSIIKGDLIDYKITILNHIKSIEDNLLDRLCLSFIEDNNNLDFIINKLKILKD